MYTHVKLSPQSKSVTFSSPRDAPLCSFLGSPSPGVSHYFDFRHNRLILPVPELRIRLFRMWLRMWLFVVVIVQCIVLRVYP